MKGNKKIQSHGANKAKSKGIHNPPYKAFWNKTNYHKATTYKLKGNTTTKLRHS